MAKATVHTGKFFVYGKEVDQLKKDLLVANKNSGYVFDDWQTRPSNTGLLQ